MARVISGIFGPNGPSAPPATALRISTALQGIPIPWLLGGQQRLALNLIDYFDLLAAPAVTPGGKGGVGSGGTKGSGGQYFYSVSFVGGICEGPDVENTGQIYINGSPIFTKITGTSGVGPDHLIGKVNIPGAGNGGQNATVSFEAFLGDYAQPIWGYLIAAASGTLNIGGYGLIAALPFGALREIAYRGTCYIGFENFPLGPSPTLPQITLEVRSTNSGINGQLDGDPSVCISKFLTDSFRGVGFPSSRLGDTTLYSNYAQCFGLLVSPVVVSGVTASSMLDDICKATNVAPCWQDGLLTFVPYGDASQTAGQVVQVTEAHQVPLVNTNAGQINPLIQVQNFATFAGDLGVTYTNAIPFTKVTVLAPTGASPWGTPAQGQYYYGGNGKYYFNPLDVAQGINITYAYAATASYLPSTVSVYDFTIDDFLPNRATMGHGHGKQNDPVAIVRKSRDDMLNNVRVEYLDRANNYNPVLIERKDEASIVQFGRMRPSEVRPHHFFCLAAAAQQSASLQLAREQIARTFQWTVGRHFMLILELMMVCTVTNPGQGLNRQAVRVTEFRENDDGSLTITAEEYPLTLSAPIYGQQASQGYQINYDVDPGSVNAPIIFEPPAELGNGFFVWAGISGANQNWGGAVVWFSNDGVNYSRIGIQQGRSRMGKLTAGTAAVSANVTGQTIDAVNTVSVDLSASFSLLSSGTIADATNLNNAFLIDTEIMSYETATLASQYNYSLSYLVRAAYGTQISAHFAGGTFLRLDNEVFKFPFNPSQIGKTIYLKFQSFNIFEGGIQSLANVQPYTYVIQGTALASSLPQVANLRTVFNAQSGFIELWWDELTSGFSTEWRPILYEIRTGTSAAAALSLGTVAHPPFPLPGDGTFWVAGVTTPIQGVKIYSTTWSSATVSGAVLTQNVVLTYDLKANGWPGIFTNGAGIDNGLNAIRTGGGNILSDSNILTTSDMLNYGNGVSGQYYPANVFIDMGYLAQAQVNIIYLPTGVPVGQNILTMGNVLIVGDILDSASTQFISVYPLINVATALGGDLYSLGDLYNYPDLYAAGDYNWGGFQKFTPGVYQARALNFYMELDTIDPGTIAYCLSFAISITIPARIDTYSLTTSASGTTTVTFAPTGQAAAAFAGGPASGNLPAIQGTIINASAGDDLMITSLGLSSLLVAVKNGGSFVARAIILTAEGF